jgi:5,10-methylene-tetrahydrofolate dehydrogenase/methenyl tetrahydrofolate cyclohydrolase
MSVNIDRLVQNENAGVMTTSTTRELDGRRALVTGGSKGIGAAIAQRLIDAGASVMVAARPARSSSPPICVPATASGPSPTPRWSSSAAWTS